MHDATILSTGRGTECMTLRIQRFLPAKGKDGLSKEINVLIMSFLLHHPSSSITFSASIDVPSLSPFLPFTLSSLTLPWIFIAHLLHSRHYA